MSWFKGEYLNYLNPYNAVTAVNEYYIGKQINQQTAKAELLNQKYTEQTTEIESKISGLITTAMVVIILLILFWWFLM